MYRVWPPGVETMLVPEGPQMQRFSARAIHSSVLSACCVAAEISEAAGAYASNVLPSGNPLAPAGRCQWPPSACTPTVRRS
jgi:hypothetical protein